MTKVLYPGSFDPLTKGHMSIISQASELFDEVVIAVMQNVNKSTCFFNLDERLELIRQLYKNYDKIKVIKGSGAATDIAILNECKVIIRGLRGLTDFDYEIGLANINKQISNNSINTVCLFASSEYQFVSSSTVKEVFNLGKDISRYVDPIVIDAMKRKSTANLEKTYEYLASLENKEIDNACSTVKRLMKEKK